MLEKTELQNKLQQKNQELSNTICLGSYFLLSLREAMIANVSFWGEGGEENFIL